MLLRLTSFILSLSFIVSPLYSADWWDKVSSLWQDKEKDKEKSVEPMMRILLKRNLENVQLEVRGRYRLINPHTDSFIAARSTGKNRLLEAVEDGLKWGESFPGIYQIKIEPIDSTTELFLDEVPYTGNLYFYAIEGKVYVVNEIPLEEYVNVSLLPYQDLTLESETLAALAIAARTNAFMETLNPRNTFWNIDAEKVNYQGPTAIEPAISQATMGTRSMIISRTGLYEGVATPFFVDFDVLKGKGKETQASKISLEEAEQLAKQGHHAAQILIKAFPGISIMLVEHDGS